MEHLHIYANYTCARPLHGTADTEIQASKIFVIKKSIAVFNPTEFNEVLVIFNKLQRGKLTTQWF